MRVLLDECVPRKLRDELPGHDVKTIAEMKWTGTKNGDLLKLAEVGFDVLVTVDQRIPYQQNLAGRTIAIAVLPTTQWPLLEAQVDSSTAQIGTIQPGSFVDITIS